MLADVLAHKSSENTMGEAVASLSMPRRTFADSFLHHFFQAQALGTKLDFVHRAKFGFAAFVFHWFQAACFHVHCH